MKIDKKITSPYNFGDKRSTKDIVYIVLQTMSNKPTGHYHVVKGNVIQVIPDDFICDSVSGPCLNKAGRLHGVCTKYNSITICISDDPTKEDIEIIPHLVMTIKRRYKINDNNILRQKDITGEQNPQVWVNDEKWKRDVVDKLADMV